jgi:adenylosuccinate lyase
MTAVIKGLVVFPQRMLENLEATRGVWAGNRVRDALLGAGIDPNTAYDYVQTTSFAAVDAQRHVRELFAERPLSSTDPRTARDIIGAEAFEQLFDAKAYVSRGINHIFK